MPEEPSAEIDEQVIEVKTRSIFDQPKESKVSLVTASQAARKSSAGGIAMSP